MRAKKTEPEKVYFSPSPASVCMDSRTKAMASPMQRVSGRTMGFSPRTKRTALWPARVPVTMASVWPTRSPAFSPAQKRLATPMTFSALSRGAMPI